MSDPDPVPLVTAPNAERYMLESENLRRRQLHSALLHGSGRSWRESRRIWPAALAGAVVVAVIIAVIGVYGAFQRQQNILDEEQRRRQSMPAATMPSHVEAGRLVVSHRLPSSVRVTSMLSKTGQSRSLLGDGGDVQIGITRAASAA